MSFETLDTTLVGRTDPELLVVEFVATQRPELKDLIILHYAGTVERIARKYSGLEPMDDLVQVGYIGLLNALSKFDPEAGVRFSTYATHLVTGEIKHYLRDRTQTIRHPAWLQEMRQKVQKAAARLQGDLLRTPSVEEIAMASGVSVDQVKEAFSTQDTLRVASLDANIYDDEDSESDLDRLDSGLIDNEAVTMEEKMVLQHAISQLRDLEQEVLILYHFETLNQTEIAHRLGISCNYVSHILRQSHSKLRKILSAEEAEDLELRGERRDDRILDPSTGMYSETYFRQRLGEEIHRASGTGGVVSVLVFELKGMGPYRQFYGQQSADELLADLGDLLKSSVRALDVVCRLGATGFGVILPATGDSREVAQKRLESRARAWLSGRIAGASSMKLMVGGATAPHQGTSVKVILRVAVEAFDPSVARAA